MRYYRPRCSTEPNCCLPVACYWFDSQISPGSSLTDSMNGSNAVMIGTPTRYVTILGHRARVMAARLAGPCAAGTQCPPGVDDGRGVPAERALRALLVLSDCGLSHA